MNQIKNRYTGKIICEGEESIKELAWKNRADLSEANLAWANLTGADLSGANLTGADLSGADLAGADLAGADLAGADLAGANLAWANLAGADLAGANLAWANLTGADLSGANLTGADLSGAKIEFYQFPSIRLLSSIPLYYLSDNLTLELMRRDAWAHPHPERFDTWAKGGQCPYQNEEGFWRLQPNKALWRKGNPQMRDSDLIVEICKSQGWKIKGYLD